MSPSAFVHPVGRPLVLGHRGAPRLARENTLEAFVAARELGADGVELDVRATSDGALVVHHDAAAEGLGVLAEHSLAEIRVALPFVPTLEEVFEACTGMLVNVEIKNSPADADFDPEERVAAAVVELVRAGGLYATVLVSSFHLPTIDRVHALDPDLATGYLFVLEPTVLEGAEVAAAHGHRAIHPFFGVLAVEAASTAVRRAHERGLDVNVWTVNGEDDIARLAAAGVNTIMTDLPDVALGILG
ncbi:MAG: glycerophosphodiester phosphodiesterase [Actinobacteria bacterium]|nr:glycerophosphodiester phosphodiesterase [Actinomycetota bacterium]